MLGSANPRPGEAGFCVVEQRAHAGTPHQQKSGRHLLVNLCGKLSSCAFVPGTQREAVVSGGISCEEYTAGGHVLARVIALLHVLARFWHRAGTEGTTQGQGLGGQPKGKPTTRNVPARVGRMPTGSQKEAHNYARYLSQFLLACHLDQLPAEPST